MKRSGVADIKPRFENGPDNDRDSVGDGGGEALAFCRRFDAERADEPKQKECGPASEDDQARNRHASTLPDSPGVEKSS